MLNPKDIFPIGIGSWGLGGFMQKDDSIDPSKESDAVAYSIDRGMNYIETGIWGETQHTIRIVADGVKKSVKQREDLFYTLTVDSENLENGDTLNTFLNTAFEILETNYLDCLQLEMRVFAKRSKTDLMDILKPFLEENKIRFISLTNNDLATLQHMHKLLGDKLFSQEIIYNFEIRDYEDWGNLEFANINKIRNVVFQPLRRNRTSNNNYPLLQELSKKYGKTQNQIILNWLVAQNTLPITKSSNISHIDEHIDSLTFKLDEDDMRKMNEFRHPKWKAPLVDWYELGEGGIPIHQFPNQFDSIVGKQP